MTVRLPAEWEPQSGLLLTWPHAGMDWGAGLDTVEKVFADIVHQTCKHQPVVITCCDQAHTNHVNKRLQQHGIAGDRYRLYVAASNDAWARDHGPITVMQNDEPVLLDFTFNGWGQKYPAEFDNRITRKLHQANAFGKTPLEKIDFVLEGGSIDTDGRGTLLVTTSCLLSSRRNGHLTKDEIENRLADYLGITHITWINHGQLQGDDTDGHIDTLMRFINTDTIVYVACNDRRYPNYRSLNNMKEEFLSLAGADNHQYELIPLPLPRISDSKGRLLPASYTNFVMINNAVLVPLYDVPEDDEAMAVFEECFGRRKIIGIHCRPLIYQSGGLHCVTMQLPVGVIS